MADNPKPIEDEKEYTLVAVRNRLEVIRSQAVRGDRPRQWNNKASYVGHPHTRMTFTRGDISVVVTCCNLIEGISELEKARYDGKISVPVKGEIFPRIIEQVAALLAQPTPAPRTVAMDMNVINGGEGERPQPKH